MLLENHQQLYHTIFELYLPGQYTIKKGSSEIIILHIS